MYKEHAQRTGVAWDRRDYDVDDFGSGHPVNQALSAANTCLYGVVHSVVVALGCSPGLGFVHTGHVRSFVYDVADLYKAEIAIPVAFDVAALNPSDLPAVTRRKVRDVIAETKLLKRCSQDIRHLLEQEEEEEGSEGAWDVVNLWDGGAGFVAGGTSYSEGSEES